jgi:AcrR family transcriptional regulator
VPTDTWWNLPDDKRRRITTIAMEEFGARGFSAGSLNVIARDAGIAKGSLFQYFDDKLDFFATICGASSEEIKTTVLHDIDVEAEPFFAALRHIVTNWIAYFRDHPIERAIAFAAANEVDPDARAAVRSVTNEQFVSVLAPMAKHAAARGELREGVDVDQVVSMATLLLRHLNAAPFYEHADPVLALPDRTDAEVDRISHDLIDALARAYEAEVLK